MYLLKSPTEGIVNFSLVWSSTQYINVGEKIFSVIADKPGKVIGRCNIPLVGAGKINAGQNVVIKLDAFPYMEYGMLTGKVLAVSSIPNEIATINGVQKFVIVEVLMPDTLITTYQKQIPFEGELTGIAEINTREMSLLEHFINPLRYLINKSS